MILAVWPRRKTCPIEGPDSEQGALPITIFVLGYLFAWAGIQRRWQQELQWGLEHAGLLHQMLMWSTSTTLTALLLIAAGLHINSHR